MDISLWVFISQINILIGYANFLSMTVDKMQILDLKGFKVDVKALVGTGMGQ